MSEPDDAAKDSAQPGKTRTWWHPLLVQVLDHVVSAAYEVRGEVNLGKMPLRADVVIIRRESGVLPPERIRLLAAVSERLNRWTLLEYKSPTDLIQQGDLNYLIGCAHLYGVQQAELIGPEDLSLILLAPSINEALRKELELFGWTCDEEQTGVHRIGGPPFTTWIIETDPLAGTEEPVLTLFSRVFLRQRRGIIQELARAGFGGVLYYMLQQIQQFQAAGEQFMIQHKDVDLMNDVAEELRASVLEAIPPEERLRGLPAEERLRGLPAEERLRGLPAEERLRGLPAEERLRGLPAEEVLRHFSLEEILAGLGEEELARLRRLLDREGEGGS